jgi:predicted transcriptional regulator
MGDNVLTVNGTDASLTVKGKVMINGQDLEERLKTIEKVLMIPERDVTMEAKYPSLKKKYDEYIKELSKYRMWDTIKGDDNGTT